MALETWWLQPFKNTQVPIKVYGTDTPLTLTIDEVMVDLQAAGYNSVLFYPYSGSVYMMCAFNVPSTIETLYLGSTSIDTYSEDSYYITSWSASGAPHQDMQWYTRFDNCYRYYISGDTRRLDSAGVTHNASGTSTNPYVAKDTGSKENGVPAIYYTSATINHLYINGVEQIVPIVTSSGGGATHIAKRTGLLATLSEHVSDILIVAGGGGGGGLENTAPGNGGGYQGGNPKLNDTPISGRSGTQSTGNAFGKGQDSATSPGGGGGFYGGLAAQYGVAGAGAGSGYIGNSALFNKKMYGNNVPESSDAGTKTTSVTSKSSSAISNKPKVGDGYVKIKYLRAVEPVTDSYFFHPDFYTDGHDTVRYDPNTKVVLYTSSYENPDVEVGIGELHGEEVNVYEEPPQPPEWYVNNGILYQGENPWNEWYYWNYSANPYLTQEIVDPNATIIINIKLRNEPENTDCFANLQIRSEYDTPGYQDAKIYFLCNDDPDYPEDEFAIIGGYYFDEDNWNIPNHYVSYTPANLCTTGVNIQYKMYLTNKVLTRIEYYIDGELYQSFDYQPEYPDYYPTFWNIIGDGENIKTTNAIILDSNANEISDFYIKLE